MASDRPAPKTSTEPGPRSQARDAALQVLYSIDSLREPAAIDVNAVLTAYWHHLDGPAAGRPYGDVIVRGVIEHRAAIDDVIRAASPNWRLERMARVDRNLLRLGAWEILHNPEVPAQVIIDEAVELARTYGAEGAFAFVNGLLDRIAHAHGRL